MLQLSHRFGIPLAEIEMTSIRAQGAGGQNVNKVASAVHLRFDIRLSSLPDAYKEQLLMLKDQRISSAGCVIIKAQQYRTREQNREDALSRLRELILGAMVVRKARKATRPSKASQRRRLDSKNKHGQLKATRGRPDY